MDENEVTKSNREENRRMIILIVAMFAVAFIFLLLIILFIFYANKSQNTQDPVIFIYNLDGTEWSESEDLDVFYNEEFGSEIIAPYSSGTFGFLLKNESDYTLEYNISLGEYNDYDIALCYKLKRDGSYLTDDYARIKDFDCETLTIEKNSYHYFELEWYWDGDVNDVNDTLAGISHSIYTLTITIDAAAA